MNGTWTGRGPYNHKLTVDDLAHLRALLADGTWTKTRIAREFEISRAMLWYIERGLRHSDPH